MEKVFYCLNLTALKCNVNQVITNQWPWWELKPRSINLAPAPQHPNHTLCLTGCCDMSIFLASKVFILGFLALGQIFFTHLFRFFLCIVVFRTLLHYDMWDSDVCICKVLFLFISELPRYWYPHNSLQSNRTQTSKSSGTQSPTNTSKTESWVAVQEEMTTVSPLHVIF